MEERCQYRCAVAGLFLILLAAVSPSHSLASEEPDSERTRHIPDPSPADDSTILIADPGDKGPLANRTPLILIHGIHGNQQPDGTDSISNPALGSWMFFLRYFDTEAFRGLYKVYRFNYESDKFSVWEIARALRNDLDSEIETNDSFDTSLVIIAHSMGGLVARSYMNEHSHNLGRYAHSRGGERVLKLITLGTPHHGTPGALSQSRDELATNAKWRAVLDFASAFYWSVDKVLGLPRSRVRYNEPNRKDLLWDNFDGRFGPNSEDLNVWLYKLNYEEEKYASIITTYYGYIEATDPALMALVDNFNVSDDGPGDLLLAAFEFDRIEYLKGKLLVGNVAMDFGLSHVYRENDGLVPKESGALSDLAVDRVECPGYDHLDMRDGSSGLCENGLTLFESVGVDVGLNSVASPRVSVAGVVNGASFLQGPVAAGEIVSIFGTDMGRANGLGTQLDESGRVSSSLGGTQVLFDGIPAPLFFVRADQINAQVPYTVTEQSTTQLQVIYDGQSSNEVDMPVALSAPGLFVYLDGSNRAIVVHLDGTLNSQTNPASSGEIVVLYATGEGQTEPSGEDGKLAAQPLPQPILPLSLTIGGQPAEVLYGGSAPGFAGLLQLNAKVPSISGGDAPVVLTIGEASSQPGVTMSVQVAPIEITSYQISTLVKGGVSGMAVDNRGDLYVSSTDLLGNNLIYKVTPEGVVSTVVGPDARLPNTRGLALDDQGNIYVAETGKHRILKVTPTGAVVIVAGNELDSFSGDDGPAISASLDSPRGVAVDTEGNLYIADTDNHRIRKVSSRGIISTVAGSGPSGPAGGGFGGDGGPATGARLKSPTQVLVDPAGALYISDAGNHRVRKVTAEGLIQTLAGVGVPGFNGDGGPANFALLDSSGFGRGEGLALDNGGNLFIADTNNHRIRKVAPDGTITTIAGDGCCSLNRFGGDGGPALEAQLDSPRDVAVDGNGNLYVADTGRIRKLIPFTELIDQGSYFISTVAGRRDFRASRFPFDRVGQPATAVEVRPIAVASDRNGNVYFSEYVHDGISIGKVTPNGIISTIVPPYFTVEGEIALFRVTDEIGLAVDDSSSLYFWTADTFRPAIIKMTPTGETSVVARFEVFADVAGLAVDVGGNLFVAADDQILKVSPSGTIDVVAGTGERGFSGDGGPATAAKLDAAAGVAIDNVGNVYFIDLGNRRVRKVTAGGIITTVVGNGQSGFSGDGGPATAAQLGYSESLAVDERGNLYIADTGNDRIRKVTPDGVINTIAGGVTPLLNCSLCNIGDGGPANSALLGSPLGVAVDSSGNIFIAERDLTGRIRKLTPR